MTTCKSGSSPDCNFTCPNGGSWFVCDTAPYFVGCCASDPCNNTTSPACPSLYAASFNGAIFDEILPNRCLDNPSSDWYTCNGTSPKFLGCCSSNPCSDGCPDDDLLPAAWSSSSAGQLKLFQDNASATATATASPTSTSTQTSSPENSSSHHSSLSGGAIAGIAIGAAALVAIIVFAIFFLRRRRRREATAVEAERQHMYPGEYGYQSPHSSPYQDSHMSSPDPASKYPSGSTGGFTMSPPASHIGPDGRPVSEIYSRGEEHLRPTHGLGLSAPTKVQPIPELDSTQPRATEVHELDGLNAR
ncbi:hypothetical protein ASPACDRAFT_127838 [Aspergillus aculeatus ATCC 16872]|uniref:Uncharacterized protein n=1 Tax=Aspergillus aculeatus (strain ATCC 16872 / CBS 172.66 / WB 5094) TaxID=690307 RepID=A0A1L9WFI9_ASPA1|nr:uncharacterized protein ASPACDRAFT_127838 [Aspergillus aculeatus ATCC 16872]OJJ94913.1 hypothetical protein ASPACDRAFT_127838 [Aspergillus aculeatus ATCC 16872]